MRGSINRYVANRQMSSKANSEKILLLLFCLGISLRLLLFLANPPDNAFDDHFTPIFKIMETGTIPPKDDCWECNQPPVFYLVSAFIGTTTRYLGADDGTLLKVLQGVSFVCGAILLAVLYLFLQRIPLSDFARVLTFGAVCFLPRHIYMSALHSNDTITYLFVVLCLYVQVVAIDNKFTPRWLMLWSLCLAIAIFTKYTALILLPTTAAVFVVEIIRPIVLPRRQAMVRMAAVLLLPTALLGWYMFSNV